MNRFFAVALGFLVLGVSGCSRDQFLYWTDKQAAQAVDRDYAFETVGSVDLIWVIDNSGSMGVHQQRVIENAERFMSVFTKNKLDWKLGLISTDEDEDPYVGFAVGNELTNRDPNPVGRFRQAVERLGTSGSGTEKTFTPLINAVRKYPNFLRKGSTFALIVVTDAEEQSSINGPDAAVEFAKIATAPVRKLFYGVFPSTDLSNGADCEADSSPWAYNGSPYQLFAQSFFSQMAYSMCDGQFGDHLAGLAADIVKKTPNLRIRLLRRPVVESIRLFFDGQSIPPGTKEDGGFWYYDPLMNMIVIHDPSFANGNLEKIRVKYDEAEESR